MYIAKIFYGANSWETMLVTDSFQECLDKVLDAYLHRQEDFRFAMVNDKFGNTPFQIDKHGTIEQFVVDWETVHK